MLKNELIKSGDKFYRILAVAEDKVLVINCIHLTMPKWVHADSINDYSTCTEEELLGVTNRTYPPIESLNQEQMKIMHNRFTLIAPVLSYVDDEHMRSLMIEQMSERHNVSKQTVRKYLCLYLAFPNMTILAPMKKEPTRALTADEKNFRWALNKYYYTRFKNSLRTTYLYLLRDKYTDENGVLADKYPSYRQFQYFYSKTKKMQTYYISRDGLTNYQRNNRPLLGEGIREFATNVSVGMLDSTICDIYLVNDVGEVVGRPILTACVDAYSSMCLGYSLGWEGGMYSLRNLMLNIVADKVELCKKFGISISKEEWDCTELPSELVTDRGSEYKSENFEQISELGVSVTTLSPYRAEQKGPIEKFFDCIQSLYKPHLKGKGVIETDFQERGGHDYRKDACLTLQDFEKVLIHCILYYNNHRIVSKEMMLNGVKPYASDIWKHGKNALGANLISVDSQTLALCLLPRTKAKFSRRGLIVNNLRYKADGYTEQMLRGDKCIVAYNSEDVSNVWLIEDGKYVPFTLILSNYMGLSLDEVKSIEKQKKAVLEAEEPNAIKARIDLIEQIETVANNSHKGSNNLSNIRETRKREQRKTRIDPMGGDTHG